MAFVAVAIAGGALLGGVVSAVGANAAAGTQASAAENAAQLQAQTANNSLLYQGALSNTETANQQPWYQSGEGALSQLDSLMGVMPGAPAGEVNVPSLGIGPGGQSSQLTPQNSLNGEPGTWGQAANGQWNFTPTPPTAQGSPAKPTAQAQFQAAAPGTTATDANGNPTGGATSNAPLLQGWNQTFQAPSAAEAAATPGEQYMLQQAQLAGNMSAAASGNLLTGGTAKALENNAQGMASTNYQNAYSNALQGYDTNFNTFETNSTNQYNRLAAMAGLGQTSASQLNSNLANTGANVASTMGNAANSIGQQMNNAGAATASGYAGMANAGSGALSSLGSTASQYGMLQALMNMNNSGVPTGSSSLMNTLG